MKLAFVLLLSLFTQAYAATCLPAVVELREEDHHPILRKVDTLEAFTPAEKRLVRSFLEVESAEHGIRGILDMDEDDNQPGYNAGGIIYYHVAGKVLVYVYHYPGDNEFGRIYLLIGKTQFKPVADVIDGDLECR